MVVHKDLEAAADDMIDSALIGQGWTRSLERLAFACGARAAVLTHKHTDRLMAVIWTSELEEAAADFLAGRVPPNQRMAKVLPPVTAGFRVDHDDFSADEMRVDRYYQEFARPRGFFWHANARLFGDTADHVALGLKRSAHLEPYQPEDVRLLNSVLPRLRAAVRVARAVLDAEARGMAHVLYQRGQPVFEFDSWGRVLRVHGEEPQPGGPANDSEPGFLQRQRLVAADRHDQEALDRALAAAITPPQRPALAQLHSRDGTAHYLQFVPVGGAARDVFHACAAVAVLIGNRRPRGPGGSSTEPLRQMFKLTGRESLLAALLCDGLALPEIAREMQVEISTARNHLKSVFQKTGTTRQAELVAMLGRIAPHP